MHLSDALLSPAVGAAGWLLAAGLARHAASRVERVPDANVAPLMGVLGAFVFAAEMINFAVPGTGSSGHLGGGLLLAVLLGPHAAFLVMTSVVVVQALLFGDGGLLALGCNVVNLGALPCYGAYPLVFLPLAYWPRARGSSHLSPRRVMAAAVAAAVVGLALGAGAVVVQTTLSGIAQLPTAAFLGVMVPIHIAIGVVEGVVTAGVIGFVWRARPDLASVDGAARGAALSAKGAGARRLFVPVTLAAAAVAVALSGLASTQPDGLEWSIATVAGATGLAAPVGIVHEVSAALQRATAILPDYTFGNGPSAPAWAASRGGTSLAGLVGAALTLGLAAALGAAISAIRARLRRAPESP